MKKNENKQNEAGVGPFFTNNIGEKMSILYMVPGLELTTFGTRVSFHNHKTPVLPPLRLLDCTLKVTNAWNWASFSLYFCLFQLTIWLSFMFSFSIQIKAKKFVLVFLIWSGLLLNLYRAFGISNGWKDKPKSTYIFKLLF